MTERDILKLISNDPWMMEVLQAAESILNHFSSYTVAPDGWLTEIEIANSLSLTPSAIYLRAKKFLEPGNDWIRYFRISNEKGNLVKHCHPDLVKKIKEKEKFAKKNRE